ncbi:hypothetical protein K9M42_02660, partial [Patescibacteria group bacterium]|nr:hypothetical protein [Patescibacteria group bacterium]
QKTSLEAKDRMYINEALEDEINIYNFPMIKSFLLQDGFINETKRKVFWDSCFKNLNLNAIKHNKKRREKLNEQNRHT